MKTVSVNLYTFDELSEKAKQKARDWFAAQGWDDTTEAQASLRAFEKVFPVRIKDWNVGWGGDYIRFFFEGKDEIEALSGWRLATYIWNNYRDDIYKGKYYSTKGFYDENKKYHYKFRHSKVILESGSCPFTGDCYDEDLLDPLWKFLKNPSDSICFSDLMRMCLDSWVKCISSEADYHTTDEYISETCDANDYHFLESGKFWS
jgi:hypothetical protein